jgi:hypothetical protein
VLGVVVVAGEIGVGRLALGVVEAVEGTEAV